MANALYPLTKAKFLQATVDMSAGTIKAALIDTGTYTYSASHDFWNDASAGVVGTPQTIGSKTFAAGVFDGDDVTFSALTGSSVEAIIIYLDTGTASTSPLIAYIDTSVTGLPLTPSGADVTIAFNASGIFAL